MTSGVIANVRVRHAIGDDTRHDAKEHQHGDDADLRDHEAACDASFASVAGARTTVAEHCVEFRARHVRRHHAPEERDDRGDERARGENCRAVELPDPPEREIPLEVRLKPAIDAVETPRGDSGRDQSAEDADDDVLPHAL